MEILKILIVIFSLLFLFERKPMNIIFNFIGIIITVAIILAYHNTDYLSYLLIIVYCSALTIIFGFVIMLTPTPSFSNSPYLFLPFLLFLTLFAFTDFSSFSDLFSSSFSIHNPILLEKIGLLLYQDPLNIFKFIIATLILLLALVALFFTLLPTL